MAYDLPETDHARPRARFEPDTSALTAVAVDHPADGVRRITLDRPEKRNALGNTLRGELLAVLRDGDADPDVRVMVIRGAGTCFSAGYDLQQDPDQPLPHHTAPGDGQWPRHVTDSWMSIWDLATPVIAQVHGWCLAGGSELATGCDLVYVAHDAQVGYPAVRFGVPDMQFHAWFLGPRRAMEMMLTGDAISGDEAVALGWANRAFPEEELDEAVLAVAHRIALIPPDIAALNKRTVHRAMDVMGLRAAIRAGTEMCTLATHQPGFEAFLAEMRSKGLTSALTERDAPFGDYRTGAASSDADATD
ncbi:MAG: enoyl-CoA hydratase-related protein [Iamia sp.]